MPTRAQFFVCNILSYDLYDNNGTRTIRGRCMVIDLLLCFLTRCAVLEAPNSSSSGKSALLSSNDLEPAIPHIDGTKASVFPLLVVFRKGVAGLDSDGNPRNFVK